MSETNPFVREAFRKLPARPAGQIIGFNEMVNSHFRRKCSETRRDNYTIREGIGSQPSRRRRICPLPGARQLRRKPSRVRLSSFEQTNAPRLRINATGQLDESPRSGLVYPY
jgi:hypothetical protein